LCISKYPTREAIDRLNASLLNTSHVLLVVDVVQTILVSLLLNNSHGDVRNGIITIEDTGNLLKSGTLGLRIDEVHPDKLNSDPDLDKF
jgi:hypothetical protein